MPNILLGILYKLSHEPHKYKVDPRSHVLPPGPFPEANYCTEYSKWANDYGFPGNLS